MPTTHERTADSILIIFNRIHRVFIAATQLLSDKSRTFSCRHLNAIQPEFMDYWITIKNKTNNNSYNKIANNTVCFGVAINMLISSFIVCIVLLCYRKNFVLFPPQMKCCGKRHRYVQSQLIVYFLSWPCQSTWLAKSTHSILAHLA